ncbi:hypothetical protein BUALT_Bualt01G0158800 [Buddleja alternifolia]|uniref:Uncharacterized protein n=1 Tax=Buddleja alternifolia TaxID=168488 RepID=A0AAV6YEI2_9LAMI|nr:hypothetical protein BUALT_Bualt01G0158800 [Buddleja alternifolia]
MSSDPKAEDIGQAADSQQEPSPVAAGWGGKIEGQYRRLKEHAETYPYVWGSYILVYGGFGLWLTYRWRKLRTTEDRVRVLQERLRKLVEAEKSTNSATAVTEKSVNSVSLTNKSSPSADKATKYIIPLNEPQDVGDGRITITFRKGHSLPLRLLIWESIPEAGRTGSKLDHVAKIGKLGVFEQMH